MPSLGSPESEFRCSYMDDKRLSHPPSSENFVFLVFKDTIFEEVFFKESGDYLYDKLVKKRTKCSLMNSRNTEGDSML